MSDSLKLENQICHRLYIASNGLTRLYRPLLKDLELTYPQYIVMMALWEKDLLTMGELSKNTSMDKGFLTTTIKRLADQKIITLKTDAKDSRKKIVKLTAKGTKLKVKAEKIPEMLICKVSECLKSEINFEEFKKSLDILNSAIKDIK